MELLIQRLLAGNIYIDQSESFSDLIYHFEDILAEDQRKFDEELQSTEYTDEEKEKLTYEYDIKSIYKMLTHDRPNFSQVFSQILGTQVGYDILFDLLLRKPFDYESLGVTPPAESDWTKISYNIMNLITNRRLPDKFHTLLVNNSKSLYSQLLQEFMHRCDELNPYHFLSLFLKLIYYNSENFSLLITPEFLEFILSHSDNPPYRDFLAALISPEFYQDDGETNVGSAYREYLVNHKVFDVILDQIVDSTKSYEYKENISEIIIEILRKLQNEHYEGHLLDPLVSEENVKKYIKSMLDPTHGFIGAFLFNTILEIFVPKSIDCQVSTCQSFGASLPMKTPNSLNSYLVPILSLVANNAQDIFSLLYEEFKSYPPLDDYLTQFNEITKIRTYSQRNHYRLCLLSIICRVIIFVPECHEQMKNEFFNLFKMMIYTPSNDSFHALFVEAIESISANSPITLIPMMQANYLEYLVKFYSLTGPLSCYRLFIVQLINIYFKMIDNMDFEDGQCDIFKIPESSQLFNLYINTKFEIDELHINSSQSFKDHIINKFVLKNSINDSSDDPCSKGDNEMDDNVYSTMESNYLNDDDEDEYEKYDDNNESNIDYITSGNNINNNINNDINNDNKNNSDNNVNNDNNIENTEATMEQINNNNLEQNTDENVIDNLNVVTDKAEANLINKELSKLEEEEVKPYTDSPYPDE